MRQSLDDEFRKYLVIARQRACHRIELVIGVNHDADRQEQSELEKYDEPTQNKRLLSVTLILTRK